MPPTSLSKYVHISTSPHSRHVYNPQPHVPVSFIRHYRYHFHITFQSRSPSVKFLTSFPCHHERSSLMPSRSSLPTPTPRVTSISQGHKGMATNTSLVCGIMLTAYWFSFRVTSSSSYGPESLLFSSAYCYQANL